MKHLGLVYVLLLLGIGLFIGPAIAQLTASQSVPPSIIAGENAMTTVTLTYYGSDATQAIITPSLPAGVQTSTPLSQTAELYPGITSSISYPISAVQCGNYIVTSLVEYSEEGTWRNLRLESPLAVMGQTMPQQPGIAPSAGLPGEGGSQGLALNNSNMAGYNALGSNASICLANSTDYNSPDGTYIGYPYDSPQIYPDGTFEPNPRDSNLGPDQDQDIRPGQDIPDTKRSH